MRTLTEVFAPGAPTLPEGLRTLVVSPDRELEPGITVRAMFTFRNQGGATATGVRVRFNLPDGLVYLVGTGLLDGECLDDDLGNSPLLARSGAQIGDVEPGEERRLEIAYSVAGAIENGSTIELQAAVASFELSPVGTNVVRLVARSKPQLGNAITAVAIEPRRDPAPGSEAQVIVRVHNAGESSAHDVVVVAPIPEFTSYVPNSARVNGREIERDLGASFDRVHAPVVIANLPASATATLIYRVRIDDPLADGTRIVATAHVASQETPAFDLEPAAFSVRSAPDFSSELTSFTLEPAFDVQPGDRVTLMLNAHNAGTCAADGVSAILTLPEGLVLARGSARVDGRPVRDRKKDAPVFDLGRIDARAGVELRAEACVISPMPNGTQLDVGLRLAWQHGSEAREVERTFERAVAVRSEPYLPARKNALENVSGTIVHPSEEVEVAIVLANDGSAPATDCTLRLRVDAGFDDVRVVEKNARLPIDGDAVELGAIEPYTQRRITLRARLRTPYADRSEVRIGASLHTHELGETPLGELRWQVDSHPSFTLEGSHLELASDAVLRPNQIADAIVRLTNRGTDVAHNVRVRVYVSPEARLETVDGAAREKSSLLFGDVAPGAVLEARLGLRLLRSLAKDYPVTIDAVLTSDAMLPVPLERLTIETTAEPDFSVGTFRSEPADVVDVGDTVEFVLHVRNGGDGPSRRVHISVAPSDALIYVPNSTTVNGVPVRDVGAVSPISSERGVVLNDVDPGIEATIRWRDVVHNGLAAGDAIERVATIRYDGERTDELIAGELRVRATPAFANMIPGLPFGLDGMVGPSLGGTRALTEERFVELPPATPVDAGYVDAAVAMPNAPRYLSLEGGRATNGESHNGVTSGGPGVVVAFESDRARRMLRFLEESRFPGFSTHLFAMRALFPDTIGSAHLSSIGGQRETLRETLDRLFIKLRLPTYIPVPRDIETSASRATLERFIAETAVARGVPGDPPTAAVVLRGDVDLDRLVALIDRVHEAPLATAVPWLAIACVIPNGSEQLAHYRTALITVLEELTQAESPEFLDVLVRREYPVLDASLDIVRASLAAAHI